MGTETPHSLKASYSSAWVSGNQEETPELLRGVEEVSPTSGVPSAYYPHLCLPGGTQRHGDLQRGQVEQTGGLRAGGLRRP